MAAHTVADLDRRLGQIDNAIEEAARRGRTNTALSAIEGPLKARAGLAGERNETAGTSSSLKAERATAAKGRQNRNRSRAHLRGGIARARHRLRTRHPVAHRSDGAVLRSARHRVDCCGFGTAINRCLKTPSGPRYL